ncbi:Adenylyl cyclase class-3/4/guanylyl cyclase [Trinorchestia longiramus]|nr:Adenylyl cyclase class-3/4/guanylyl cyclase [Trinorchestia longiramus]
MKDAVKVRDRTEQNVVTLVEFALALATVLDSINKESFQNFRLRVGIAHGPVIAGVVGAQKPQYDIWGNTVNVASRMDSSGLLGRMQVTEETAKVLMGTGLECACRGPIVVKGKGTLTTYFVIAPQEPSGFSESSGLKRGASFYSFKPEDHGALIRGNADILVKKEEKLAACSKTLIVPFAQDSSGKLLPESMKAPLPNFAASSSVTNKVAEKTACCRSVDNDSTSDRTVSSETQSNASVFHKPGVPIENVEETVAEALSSIVVTDTSELNDSSIPISDDKFKPDAKENDIEKHPKEQIRTGISHPLLAEDKEEKDNRIETNLASNNESSWPNTNVVEESTGRGSPPSKNSIPTTPNLSNIDKPASKEQLKFSDEDKKQKSPECRHSNISIETDNRSILFPIGSNLDVRLPIFNDKSSILPETRNQQSIVIVNNMYSGPITSVNVVPSNNTPSISIINIHPMLTPSNCSNDSSAHQRKHSIVSFMPEDTTQCSNSKQNSPLSASHSCVPQGFHQGQEISLRTYTLPNSLQDKNIPQCDWSSGNASHSDSKLIDETSRAECKQTPIKKPEFSSTQNGLSSSAPEEDCITSICELPTGSAIHNNDDHDSERPTSKLPLPTSSNNDSCESPKLQNGALQEKKRQRPNFFASVSHSARPLIRQKSLSTGKAFHDDYIDKKLLRHSSLVPTSTSEIAKFLDGRDNDQMRDGLESASELCSKSRKLSLKRSDLNVRFSSAVDILDSNEHSSLLPFEEHIATPSGLKQASRNSVLPFHLPSPPTECSTFLALNSPVFTESTVPSPILQPSPPHKHSSRRMICYTPSECNEQINGTLYTGLHAFKRNVLCSLTDDPSLLESTTPNLPMRSMSVREDHSCPYFRHYKEERRKLRLDLGLQSDDEFEDALAFSYVQKRNRSMSFQDDSLSRLRMKYHLPLYFKTARKKSKDPKPDKTEPLIGSGSTEGSDEFFSSDSTFEALSDNDTVRENLCRDSVKSQFKSPAYVEAMGLPKCSNLNATSISENDSICMNAFATATQSPIFYPKFKCMESRSTESLFSVVGSVNHDENHLLDKKFLVLSNKSPQRKRNQVFV